MILLSLLLVITSFFTPNLQTSDDVERFALSQPKPEDETVQILRLLPLKNAIEEQITANPDIKLSVTAAKLNSDEVYSYGSIDSFRAASVTKLLIASCYLSQVESGTSALDAEIAGVPASELIRRMLVLSDNDALYVMQEEIGFNTFQDYVHKTVGLSSLDYTNNSITSVDMAIFLRKLYRGDLLNLEHTELVLSHMKIANYRKYIVDAAPSGSVVYHKAGWLKDRILDVAIVEYGGEAYILTIFSETEGNYDTKRATTIFTAITQKANEVFFGIVED